MAVPKKKKKSSNLYIKSNFFNKNNNNIFNIDRSNQSSQTNTIYTRKINYSLLNYFKSIKNL